MYDVEDDESAEGACNPEAAEKDAGGGAGDALGKGDGGWFVVGNAGIEPVLVLGVTVGEGTDAGVGDGAGYDVVVTGVAGVAVEGAGVNGVGFTAPGTASPGVGAVGVVDG